jgi:hypothetical protein
MQVEAPTVRRDQAREGVTVAAPSAREKAVLTRLRNRRLTHEMNLNASAATAARRARSFRRSSVVMT